MDAAQGGVRGEAQQGDAGRVEPRSVHVDRRQVGIVADLCLLEKTQSGKSLDELVAPWVVDCAGHHDAVPSFLDDGRDEDVVAWKNLHV